MQSLDQIDAKEDQNGTKLDEAKAAIDATRARVEEIEAQPEKRIPINATTAPPSPLYQHRILEPGSYYLTGNLRTTGTSGIFVAVSGVTLDLNGFEITATDGEGTAVSTAPEARGLTVRNGTIRGVVVGIFISESATGFSLRDLVIRECTAMAINALAPGGEIISVRAVHNSGDYGILAGFGAVIVDTAVSNNVVADSALRARAGSTFRGCTATFNTARFGIAAEGRSTVVNCVASSNTSADAISGGFSIGSGSTVVDCTASGNTSRNGTATPTTGLGFEIGHASQVRNCTAAGNLGDGFRLSSSSLVRENLASGNGAGTGSGSGIHVTLGLNRLEPNTVTENDFGIRAVGSGNFIIKNTAGSNTVNYNMVAGNRVGTITTAPSSAAINGNTGGSGVGSTDPWANFVY